MSDYTLKNEDFSNLEKNTKIVIIVSEFNEKYTSKLAQVNTDFFMEHGFENIEIYKVPGALEIPGLANKILHSWKNIGLIITLGVVIRGDTPHFDYVCENSARGIMDLTTKYRIPIMNGILTCENEQQVEERIKPTYALSGLKTLKEYNKI